MNPWVIKARSLARKTGLIGLINRFRRDDVYERRVHETLEKAVKPGDVVWDVGANVGIYTELFCQWVGDGGFVVAFEPWAESCERIRERLPHCTHLLVENVALGEGNIAGRLVVGSASTYHRVETDSAAPSGPLGSAPALICRGDTVSERLGKIPNVLKVDVEGYEEEVLNGMGQMLTSPTLRNILVEVHFSQLERRGKMTAPSRIEKYLETAGFKTKWVDASHLFAAR